MSILTGVSCTSQRKLVFLQKNAKNIRFRVVQRLESSLRTLASGSEHSNGGRLAPLLRTLLSLAAPIENYTLLYIRFQPVKLLDAIPCQGSWVQLKLG